MWAVIRSTFSVSQVTRFLSEEARPVVEPYKSKMDVKIELELWNKHIRDTSEQYYNKQGVQSFVWSFMWHFDIYNSLKLDV